MSSAEGRSRSSKAWHSSMSRATPSGHSSGTCAWSVAAQLMLSARSPAHCDSYMTWMLAVQWEGLRTLSGPCKASTDDESLHSHDTASPTVLCTHIVSSEGHFAL